MNQFLILMPELSIPGFDRLEIVIPGVKIRILVNFTQIMSIIAEITAIFNRIITFSITLSKYRDFDA
jgi:hypothetical protein